MVIADLACSHPNAVFRFKPAGDLQGEWDRDRLAQVFSNLFGSALQHGDVKHPITIDARGRKKDVVVAIHNKGPPSTPGQVSTPASSSLIPAPRSMQAPSPTPERLWIQASPPTPAPSSTPAFSSTPVPSLTPVSPPTAVLPSTRAWS
jgi:hypothetical protein